MHISSLGLFSKHFCAIIVSDNDKNKRQRGGFLMGKKKKGFKVVTTPSGKPKLKDEQEYTYFFHTRLKGGHVAENKKGRHFRKEKHKKRIGLE